MVLQPDGSPRSTSWRTRPGGCGALIDDFLWHADDTDLADCHRFYIIVNSNGTRMTLIWRMTTDLIFHCQLSIVNCQLSLIMLRIKIPCNRATSCNSSGKLKLPSSQCLRLACPRTDAHSASAAMIKRAYHCSRCAAELSIVTCQLCIVNCQLWIVNCELSIDTCLFSPISVPGAIPQ